MNPSNLLAQDKVVVIPLFGDDNSSQDCIQDTGGTMTGTLKFQVSSGKAVDATAGSTAIQGVSTATGSFFVTYGGYFEGHTENGAGVKGLSDGRLGSGVEGIAQGEGGSGVYGEGQGENGIGVWGKSAGDNADAMGVYGESVQGNGVRGKSTNSKGVYGISDNDNGVLGISKSSNPWVPAVNGRNEIGAGDGVYGWSQNRYGTVGVTYSSNSAHAGIWGQNNGAGFGGFFSASNDDFDIVLGGARGRINSDQANENSDLYLSSNNDVVIKLDNDGGENGTLYIQNSGGTSVFSVDEAGTATTKVLTITGGSDLSERFDVSDSPQSYQVVPGMVLSIDPERPGSLAVSDSAYDRRVAGIVSGAGDVKPGMLMGHQGSLADGAYPVALTGRVYCYADAGYGSIEPGDMLTTSTTPGHAMKVADHAKAQGAIIGKAMTGLETGKGLVLVLVSLQ